MKPLRGLLGAVPALLFAGWLAAAVDEAADSRAAARPRNPSTFDYLVLASLADSPQLHALAGFRSSASQRNEPPPAQDPQVKAEDLRH
ncbi:MAG: hypothetical protein ACYDBZ_07905 [Steroidobacteraceae bacterium]